MTAYTGTYLHVACRDGFPDGMGRVIRVSQQLLAAGVRLIGDEIMKEARELLHRGVGLATIPVAFPQHPDAEIILGFSGLGIQLGARVLAEIGDDRNRFAARVVTTSGRGGGTEVRR